MVAPSMKPRDSWPAGRARELVRGFFVSRPASARRLKLIAAVRAKMQAATIFASSAQEGVSAAMKKAEMAKGRAKIEWENLIDSRKSPRCPGCRGGC